MDLINNQWDLADQDLNRWLNGDNNGSKLPISDILKSTYFVFRMKQKAWLKQICNKSFIFLRENRYKTLDDFLYEPDIHFKYATLSESERIYRDKLKKKDNEELIKGILSGDQQVFNRFYENEFPKIVRFILDNSGTLESAKDIFQDALVVFIEKAYRNELDLTCYLGTYLYSICRNLWMVQLRKVKSAFSLIDHYSHDESLRFMSIELAPDIYEHVNIAIETLGDPCKQLLECYYYQNLSWDEIANKLGYANAASARNQKYKCLERVRKIVGVES
jgi:RNA polymerase sigma factor (sigma-70 family)